MSTTPSPVWPAPEAASDPVRQPVAARRSAGATAGMLVGVALVGVLVGVAADRLILNAPSLGNTLPAAIGRVLPRTEPAAAPPAASAPAAQAPSSAPAPARQSGARQSWPLGPARAANPAPANPAQPPADASTAGDSGDDSEEQRGAGPGGLEQGPGRPGPSRYGGLRSPAARRHTGPDRRRRQGDQAGQDRVGADHRQRRHRDRHELRDVEHHARGWHHRGPARPQRVHARAAGWGVEGPVQHAPRRAGGPARAAGLVSWTRSSASRCPRLASTEARRRQQ